MNSFPLDSINFGINMSQNSILHPPDDPSPPQANARHILEGNLHEIVQSDIRIASAHLARFPARWNHLAEKESRQINMLEQILVGEVMQLRRDLL
jgi:hypothetical protein